MSWQLPSHEFGVWTKVWQGKKQVRENKEARLHGLAMRRGNTIGSWTYEKGWTEEWIIQDTGEVLRYTRQSPFHGWTLSGLGIRDVDMGDFGLWKEVAEVWVKREVTREAALEMSGIPPGRFRWCL